jgi:hypothetical protein
MDPTLCSKDEAVDVMQGNGACMFWYTTCVVLRSRASCRTVPMLQKVVQSQQETALFGAG